MYLSMLWYIIPVVTSVLVIFITNISICLCYLKVDYNMPRLDI
jgi:hypothetical protein